MAPFSPGKKLVILGAGATRGASFVGANGASCAPPLNADFFTQLQRVTGAKHEVLVHELIRDVVSLFGNNFSLTLEDYFTLLESMRDAVARSPRSDRAGKKVKLDSMRARLLDGLAAVLEESAEVTKLDPKTGELPEACAHHAKIVRSLAARDTIISFNYDCVMDHALRTVGTGKWSAKYGYAFVRPNRVDGSHWDARRAPVTPNDSINLLKLHGSLNWFPVPDDEGQPIKLRQRTYRQNGSARYEIIPPEFIKKIDERPVFRQLWQYAELAIRRAECIAFVGFSFTPTDLHVESLFRLALQDNTRLRRVVIANPNAEHRRKIREVVSGALKNSPVVQYDSIAELGAHLPTAFG